MKSTRYYVTLATYVAIARNSLSSAFVVQPSGRRLGRTLAHVDQEIYKPQKVEGKEFDTIVIGSGIGGLSAASLLAQQGQKVLVLEQHYIAGGACHTFKSKGYRFAPGIHYVGDMGPVKQGEEKALTVRRIMDSLTLPHDPVVWDRMDDPIETVVFGDPKTRYDIVAGEEALKENLMKRFPGEEKAIKKYYRLVNKARRSFERILLMKSLPLPLARFLVKTGLHRLVDGGFHKWSSMTVQEGLERLTRNKELQAILAYNWGDYGVEPSRAPFVMQLWCASTFLEGAFYPHGGPSMIPKKVIEQINNCDGQVLVKAPVKRIVLDDKNQEVIGVEMSDGNFIKSKRVVSDAGLINTVKNLLPESVVNIDFARDDSTKSGKLHPGASAISVFVGLKGSSASLNLPQNQYWLYPSHDMSESVEALKTMSLDEALQMNPRQLTPVFVGIASQKDRAFVKEYPDKSVIELITLGPQWHWFEKFSNFDKTTGSHGDEFESIKLRFAEMMWTRMSEVFSTIGSKLPKTLAEVDYVSVGTPLSFAHYYRSTRGAIYGLDHDLKRFEPNNFYLRLRPEVPEVKGLYLTGQDITADSLAAAMVGGLLCAQKVLGIVNPLRLLRPVEPVDDAVEKSPASEDTEGAMEPIYII